MKANKLRILLPSLIVISLFFIVTMGSGYAQLGPSQPTPEEAISSVRFLEAREGLDLEAQEIYLVRLSDPPLAAYRGEIPGLAATNPRVRGELKLNPNSPESLAYRDYLLAKQAAFVEKLEGLIGRKAEVKYQYYAANNGLAVYLSGEEAAMAASLPEVIFIQPNFRRELSTDVSPTWIEATGIWDGTNTGGLPGTKGEGIIVGVIDTGINPSNPSFADIGADGYNHANPWGAGNYKGVCDPNNSLYDPTFPCNDKLIGAWAYADINGGEARDYEGHGSHTASTAAGNVVNAQINGHTTSATRQISGIAPHANIVAYAACCTGDALSAAIDQIVLDGVDVANYSIGSPSPSDAWNDFDAVGFLNARDAGIFVATSAGNNGPDPATLGSPGDAPWITTVAASSHNRKVTNALINMSGGATTPPADILGASFTSGYGPANIVYAGNYGDGLCLNPFPANTWTNGEIVICDRGIIARVDKGANVQAGGAGGLILANTAADGDSIVADDHYLPAVHIGYNDGVVLKAWVAGGGGSHLGTIRGSLLETNDDWGDILTDFSSRGPNRALGDIVKPDVAAPGKDVLAAAGINDPVPAEFAFFDGTSMASPHVAGAGALLKALHPTWTPAEIQSALMTTAWQGMLDYDYSAPGIFDIGSGRIDLSVAAKAGLVLNETTANYNAANPETGGDPSTLNTASFGKGACYQTCSWTRTLRSTLGSSVTWTVEVDAFDGLDLTVTPSSFSVSGGGSQVLSVSADARRVPQDTWAYGEIRLTPSNPNVPAMHFPVAVFANSSSDLPVLEKSADINLVQVGGAIQYTVTLTHRSLTSKTYNLSDPVPANASYVNGSATGGLTYSSGTNTLTWSGTLPAGTFTIFEDNRTGYISMGDLGAPPATIPSNKDAGCLLVTLNNLVYFGTTYTQGIWSVNGALQAGVSGIPVCAGNTNGNVPSSNLPNNLLAPFWADLDLTNGGNWYFVGVSWNGASHTVFSWENVPIKNSANTASFQIWFEEGADNMWFTYQPGGIPGGSPTATIGAENSSGTLGYNYYYNGAGNLPDGTNDLVLGPVPEVRTFGFAVTATNTPDVTNTATLTEGATTRTAYAFTDVVILNTWLGNTTNWHTASNWSRNVVPGAADWVIIPTAPSGGNMPLLSNNAAAYKLEIQPGAQLDLAGYRLDVKGSVANQGTLIQTKASVPVNTATAFLNITNASGAQDKYLGLRISPSSGAMGSTSVKIKGNAQCTTSDPTDTVNRCYEILPGTPQSAKIDFFYLNSELDGQNPDLLQAWRWTGSGWLNAGSVLERRSLPGDYRQVTVGGINAYAPFVLTEKVSGPTVVEMVGLNAQQEQLAGLVVTLLAVGLLLMVALGIGLWWKGRKYSLTEGGSSEG